MRRRAALLAILLAAALTLWSGPAASAHDVLVSTDPADGSSVAATPSEIVLTFDQPALAVGSQVKVTGPSGDIAIGTPQLVDTTVRQRLSGGAPAGRYTVDWRVTSADGHPVSGSFTFSSTGPGAGSAAATSGSGAAAGATTDGSAQPAAAPDGSTAQAQGSVLPVVLLVALAVLAVVLVLAATARRRRLR